MTQPDTSTLEEIREMGKIMIDALRTIASGKKDYGAGLSDTDFSECRQIARNALRRVGCL